MAKSTPKQTDQKPAEKTKTTEVTTIATTNTNENTWKGFFGRKYSDNEGIRTIFKSPRIWGALLAELIGTMLLTMLFMTTIGVFRADLVPLLLMFAVLSIYIITVKISGANLNPFITVGMMATRRMSVVRGILYMIAQFLGAILGFLVLGAFRAGAGTEVENAALIEANAEQFWAIALIELLGAIIIAFCFARSLRYGRRSPLTFAYVISSAIVFITLLGIVISQNFFGFYENLIFNPASAVVYGIFPAGAEGFGAIAGGIALSLCAYVFVPMLGGIIGFYISDVVTRLAGRGYETIEPEAVEACCKK